MPGACMKSYFNSMITARGDPCTASSVWGSAVWGKYATSPALLGVSLAPPAPAMERIVPPSRKTITES